MKKPTNKELDALFPEPTDEEWARCDAIRDAATITLPDGTRRSTLQGTPEGAFEADLAELARFVVLDNDPSWVELARIQMRFHLEKCGVSPPLVKLALLALDRTKWPVNPSGRPTDLGGRVAFRDRLAHWFARYDVPERGRIEATLRAAAAALNKSYETVRTEYYSPGFTDELAAQKKRADRMEAKRKGLA